jgi:hypothetical protein
MPTDTALITTRAVLETMWDEKGNEIPLKKFQVTVQLTEKTLRAGQFAADSAISRISLVSGTVPDGNHYTLVYSHRGKEYRTACRVSGGQLLSQG